jgi:hypothetical protein
VPYAPDQNGVCERSNRTIFEKLRSIFHDTKAPKNLWPEIIRGIIHVTNRSATTALETKTLYEALVEDIDRRLNSNATPISFEPSIEHLKVLGCRAIVHIQKQRRTISEKAEPRAEEGILVGFEGTKIYRVWIPGRRRITRTSTVTFDEESNDELLEVDIIDNAIPYIDENPITQEPFEFDLGGDSDAAKSSDEACSQFGEEPSDDQIGEEPSGCSNSRPQSSRDRPDQSVDLDDSAIRRNPKKGARKPSRYLNLASAYSSVCDNLKTFVDALMANTDEPRSYEEAVESGNEWH